MSRAQEARTILAVHPDQRKYVSAIPCAKCGCTEMTITIVRGELRGVKCRACHRKNSTRDMAKIYATPEGCAKIKAAGLAWAKNNPGLSAAKNAKRRASKLQRTPAWADLKAIKDFYKNCPAGYDVDHIVPLQGELVSGLHVLENLQYLPASINRAKSNKFEV